MTDEFIDIKRKLSKLPVILQDKIVTKASRAAASLIAKEAKRRVPVDRGLLKRSIGVAKAKKKDTPEGVIRFYVVPKSTVAFSRKVTVAGIKGGGKLKAKVRAFHAHFVEFGTKKMGAKPFLLPAAKAVQPQVMSTFKEKIRSEIEKEVPKL